MAVWQMFEGGSDDDDLELESLRSEQVYRECIEAVLRSGGRVTESLNEVDIIDGERDTDISSVSGLAARKAEDVLANADIDRALELGMKGCDNGDGCTERCDSPVVGATEVDFYGVAIDRKKLDRK